MALCLLRSLNIKVQVKALKDMKLNEKNYCGVLVQNPNTIGDLVDLKSIVDQAHAVNVQIYINFMKIALIWP